MKKKTLRRKRLSPRSKATRANLIAACDSLWAYLVRSNAQQGHESLPYVKCEWCPRQGTDAHHMISRRRSIYMRHHLSNGVWLCPSCHHRFHNHESLSGWQHFERMRPEDYAVVQECLYRVIQVTQTDLQDTLQFLKRLAVMRGWEPSERTLPLLKEAA
jgi:hypothetical protein